VISNPTEDPGTEHFVERVVGSAHEVKACEDIVTANGIKLVAKGVCVNAATRERLLAHKLAKPLEQCLEVTEGVTGEALAAMVAKVLDEQVLVRSLCKHPTVALASLALTPQLRCLLSLYAELPSDKLEHCVTVALVAQGLLRKLATPDSGQQRVILTAGLFHDVGELYLDPACSRDSGPLEPAHWRHIAAHPVIGHRVLLAIQGAGQQVAEAVLDHHERADGFGYPRRLAGSALALRGEVLGAAEWVAGLIRCGGSLFDRASAVMKLMPATFRPEVLKALSLTGQGVLSPTPPSDARSHELLARLCALRETLQRFEAGQSQLECESRASADLSRLLSSVKERMSQIERSLARSGLTGEEPLVLYERLQVAADPLIENELTAIVGEVEWRLNELERESLLRSHGLADADRHAVESLMARLRVARADEAI
jgi:hypothetical protein